MYSVDLYRRVRRVCHVEGMSIREAARVSQRPGTPWSGRWSTSGTLTIQSTASGSASGVVAHRMGDGTHPQPVVQ